MAAGPLELPAALAAISTASSAARRRTSSRPGNCLTRPLEDRQRQLRLPRRPIRLESTSAYLSCTSTSIGFDGQMLAVQLLGLVVFPLLLGLLGPRDDTRGPSAPPGTPEEIPAPAHQGDDADQDGQTLDGLVPHLLVPLVAGDTEDGTGPAGSPPPDLCPRPFPAYDPSPQTSTVRASRPRSPFLPTRHRSACVDFRQHAPSPPCPATGPVRQYTHDIPSIHPATSSPRRRLAALAPSSTPPPARVPINRTYFIAAISRARSPRSLRSYRLTGHTSAAAARPATD